MENEQVIDTVGNPRRNNIITEKTILGGIFGEKIGVDGIESIDHKTNLDSLGHIDSLDNLPLSECFEDDLLILQYLVKRKNLVPNDNNNTNNKSKPHDPDTNSDLGPMLRQMRTKKLKSQLMEGKINSNPNELYIENQILKTRLGILQKSHLCLSQTVSILQQAVSDIQAASGRGIQIQTQGDQKESGGRDSDLPPVNRPGNFYTFV